MIESEEIYCYHCHRTFYLNGFRMREAKTISCLYCDKRIDKQKLKTELVEVQKR